MNTILLLLALSACGGASSPTTPPTTTAAPTPAPAAAPAVAVRSIDVAALKQAKDAGTVPVLVDVRTPGEFASGHVPGAQNIPLDTLSGKMAELEAWKSGEVYVICQSGGRSAQASSSLAKAGFHTVNIQGGTAAWKAAGYPTE